MACSYSDVHENRSTHVVNFISTGHSGIITEARQPWLSHDYNQHMGGVDVFDQHINYYPFHNRCSEMRQAVFIFLVRAGINQAWVWFRRSTGKPIPQLDFLIDLHYKLVEVLGDEDKRDPPDIDDPYRYFDVYRI